MGFSFFFDKMAVLSIIILSISPIISFNIIRINRHSQVVVDYVNLSGFQNKQACGKLPKL